MKRSPFLLLAVLLLFSAGQAAAQFVTDDQAVLGLNEIKGPEDVVSWSARAVPSSIGSFETSVIKLTARMNGDWKMYALDASLPSMEEVLARPYGVIVSFSDLPSGIRALDQIGQEPPEVGFDVTLDMELLYFHEEAIFYAGVESVDSLSHELVFNVNARYQVCSDELGTCLRPDTAVLPISLSIDPTCLDCGASEEDIQRTSRTEGQQAGFTGVTDYETYRSNGFWAFLLLAIGAGLASLLTPCVFPMIPLTVSYFTKHGHNRAQAVRMALIYGASIVVTFTGIGVIMAVLVGAAGAQNIASNPWVNLMIAAVLIGFALSLLGMFELRLPSSWLNWIGSRGSSENGWIGVLFMGLTLTLVSFSCTAPFVGGLLAAASGGTWAFPLFGMIAYSTTFALPFVLLAIFPNALNALPSSGSWMNAVKVVLGFVELAAAVKFLSNADLVWGLGLISRTLGIAFVLVVFFLTGMYLLGKLRFPHEEKVESVGVGRLFAAVAFFVLALYMIPGLFGAPLNALDAYLPPRQSTDIIFFGEGEAGQVSDPEEGWFVDDIEGAYAQATALGQPVFVDFSGWTCTNCRDMEANVFPKPEVVRFFEEEMVPLRLYTDDLEKGDAFHEYQMNLTGTPALPTYALVDPVSGVLLGRESALMDTEEFIAFLEVSLAAFSTTDS